MNLLKDLNYMTTVEEEKAPNEDNSATPDIYRNEGVELTGVAAGTAVNNRTLC